MKLQKIEIHAIDSKRWALLHLPLAIGLSIWCSYWVYNQAHATEKGIALAVFFVPFVTFIVCFLAWGQAVLLNWFIWCIGGPVLYVKAEEVRECDIKPIGI